MIKPPPLTAGDRIGIFLPSSPVKEEYRARGNLVLEEMGFLPVEAESILTGTGYTAKSPGEILADMDRFLRDPSVKGLIAARGGYGSNMVLDRFQWDRELKPRVMIGSSDVSYLLWAIMEQTGMPVFYGPMAYSSMAEGRFDRENFLRTVSGEYDEIRITGTALRGGKAEGTVTGGCLTNLASLCGTPHFPEVEGRIVLLEDTGERPYRLDRMLWQLSRNGFFSKVSGILFGEFPGCFRDEDEEAEFYRNIEKYYEGGDTPVLKGMPFGHAAEIKTLPLGIPARIDTADFEGIMIREKGVAL